MNTVCSAYYMQHNGDIGKYKENGLHCFGRIFEKLVLSQIDEGQRNYDVYFHQISPQIGSSNSFTKVLQTLELPLTSVCECYMDSRIFALAAVLLLSHVCRQMDTALLGGEISRFTSASLQLSLLH